MNSDDNDNENFMNYGVIKVSSDRNIIEINDECNSK